jgi:hypothetical protein
MDGHSFKHIEIMNTNQEAKQEAIDQLKIQAEKFLDNHCDSLPAWTDRRKEKVINAMLDFGKNYKKIIASIPCVCQYGSKRKNYNECEICGGKWK